MSSPDQDYLDLSNYDNLTTLKIIESLGCLSDNTLQDSLNQITKYLFTKMELHSNKIKLYDIKKRNFVTLCFFTHNGDQSHLFEIIDNICQSIANNTPINPKYINIDEDGSKWIGNRSTLQKKEEMPFLILPILNETLILGFMICVYKKAPAGVKFRNNYNFLTMVTDILGNRIFHHPEFFPPSKDQQGTTFIKICAYCRLVCLPNKIKWVKIQEYFKIGKNFQKIKFSHGICSKCEMSILK